ncbi:hypothetical protein LP418_21660 [Nocardioides sp. B-3]|nr:replication initiator [Nocardioides sp. B-3]UUZ58695.1 hypothetical protein LP418_21660 [Nocardioides sp. B-3]
MRLSNELVVAAARIEGVCERPILRRVTDRLTGEVTSVPILCGSTRENACKSCAEKARRLRMQQCREGWHLSEDPLPEVDTPPDPEDCRDDDADDGAKRRIRSTRRLSGFPELPKVPAENCSIGRTFTDPKTGAEFRPSMFVTLTLPSYGPITPGTGTPRRAGRYDYRRAALDALFFPRLVDRWWQNLRRCAGYKVQYFAAVEPQKRLAPHLHAALRGAIPRRVIKDVTAGTYCALWWPSIDRVRYPDAKQLPARDADLGGYVDPTTGELLMSRGSGTGPGRRRRDRGAVPCPVLRGAGRHPGPGGRSRRGRSCRRLPVQVPDEVDRGHVRRRGPRRRRIPGAHRPAARRAAVVAVLGVVRQLASLRDQPEGSGAGPGARRM